MKGQEHARGPVRVDGRLLGARIERAPRRGVVPSREFGAAPLAIARSDVRSRVLEYRDPASFSLAQTSAKAES